MNRREVRLDGVPGLVGLYATALRRQLVTRRNRQGAPLELPAVAHAVDGVTADPDRLVAYQRLMGDTVRDTLPSVFVHGMAFPVAMSVLAAEDFPLPLLGMVHLGNEVEHRRAIGAEEKLGVRAWAEGLRPHHAGTAFDVVCQASVSGVVVWRGVSTYLAKGVWAGVRPERAERAEPPAAARTRTGVWRLGTETGRAYAAVLGDYNPIHLGLLPAKALGLKSHIAHGMFLAGRALAATAPNNGGYRWSIDFETPVFLPASVQFGVREFEDATLFEGWSAASSRRHFSGSVRPLR